MSANQHSGVHPTVHNTTHLSPICHSCILFLDSGISLLDTRVLCPLGLTPPEWNIIKDPVQSAHAKTTKRRSCTDSCCDLHRRQQRDRRESLLRRLTSLQALRNELPGHHPLQHWLPVLRNGKKKNTCNSRNPFVVKLSWLAHMWVSRYAQVSFERLQR